MAEEKKSAFEILNNVNVNEHTEVKDTGKTKLTYLSWAWAWAEVKKRYPSASYEIIKFNGLPYVFDEKTGFMVYTTVTIEGITHEMWLPVMDGNNRAMLDHPYEVQTKYNKFTVQAATMFDVNKAIMRCLTKNLAMFGLGLYIYAGEDLPEVVDETIQQPAKKSTKKTETPKASAPVEKKEDPAQEANDSMKETKQAYWDLINYCTQHGLDVKKACADNNLSKSSTKDDFVKALEKITAETEYPDDYGKLPFEV